jgi:NMD protein affecting ribosome stability and mRNA decay
MSTQDYFISSVDSCKYKTYYTEMIMFNDEQVVEDICNKTPKAEMLRHIGEIIEKEQGIDYCDLMFSNLLESRRFKDSLLKHFLLQTKSSAESLVDSIESILLWKLENSVHDKMINEWYDNRDYCEVTQGLGFSF